MPGTPATTPRLGLARFATTDPDQVPIDLNTIVDRADLVAGYFSHGTIAARPSAGAGIVDRYYYADDEGVLYRDAGGATPTWTALNPRSRALVTALPGTPFTGQEILFQDTTILGPANIVWPLRYDGTKWVPLGQPTAQHAEVATSQTTASATYVDLTTVGPSITVPLAGDYDIEVMAQVAPPATAGAFGAMAVAVGATPAPASADDTLYQTPTAGSGGATVGQTYRKTGVAAAAAIVVKYKASGSTSFSQRKLRVRPVRVG